jgi:surface antigen
VHQQSHQPRRPLRAASACLLAAVTLLSGLLVLPPTPPAVADSTYLCTGYEACSKAGYPHAGYKGVAKTMYWRMYGGHNCTNYAAYRMVKSGMANTRPWSGEGNAAHWGKAMASITNQTPMVGSIAWWKANVPGAGSSGHVAYVEQVVSATEIVISEDSWGGDFHWRRITKGGKGWPSGFIHFNDAVLAPTTPPSIVGTPKVGVALSASQGAWKPTGSFKYQWSAGGTPIAGATARTYTPGAGEVRKRLAVTVTARKKGYKPGTAVASTATTVEPGTMALAAAPTITGTPLVDETLTATAGSWSPAPSAQSVQWYADGAAIPGATGWTLVLGQDQIDKRVTARVSVTANGYTTGTADSAPTTPVLAGTIAETAPYALTGRAAYGKVLTVSPGAVEPADASLTYTWLRDGKPVEGRTGPTYQLTSADVGHKISVRLDFARRSYRSLSRTLSAGGPVTTAPKVTVKAAGQPGRAVVRVRVWAPGAPKPGGQAMLQVGTAKQTVQIVQGYAKVVVGDLRPGKRAVRAHWEGTSLVKGAWGKTTVTVPRG